MEDYTLDELVLVLDAYADLKTPKERVEAASAEDF